MPLGENIKKFRELRGFSVQDLADKMSIGKAGIYKWESGENKPGQDSLTALSKALDVSVSELLDENPTSVQETGDNKRNGLSAVKETFYQDLIENNEDYSLLPRAVLRDYKIVPDKIIDVILQANENERKALERSRELEVDGLNKKYELIIEGYENKIERLEREKAEVEKERDDLKRQVPAKKQE